MNAKSMIVSLACAAGGLLSFAASAGTVTCTESGNWNDDAIWGGSVPAATDDVVIGAGCVVSADAAVSAASLKLESGAALSIFGESAVLIKSASDKSELRVGRAALNAESGDPIGLTVSGDVTLADGAWIAVGGFGQQVKSVVSVGGGVTLNGAAQFVVYAGPSALADRLVGGTVTVGGAFTLNDTAQYVLHGHLGRSVKVGGQATTIDGTGASVLTTADEFSVGAKAKVVANSGANMYVASSAGVPDRTNDHSGATHGGRGGRNAAGAIDPPQYVGTAYDSAFAPIMPGRQPRYLANYAGHGGGVIRIRARSIGIDGTLDASCSQYWESTLEMGGGAGGSIFLAGDTVRIAADARLSADGGEAGIHVSNCTQYVGGGGGGRIAVALGFSGSEVDALEAGTCDTTGLRTAELGSMYFGVSVKGGLGAYSGGNGEAGTAVLYAAPDLQKGVVAVETRGVVSVEAGVAATIVPADNPIYLNAARTSRRVVSGYVAEGEPGEGASCEVTVAAGAEAAVSWTYGATEHLLAVETAGDGTVSAASVWAVEGDAVTVTATPGAGGRFVAWLVDGIQPRKALTNEVLQLTLDRPHRAVAVFAAAGGLTAKEFTGANGGRWDEQANWSPSGVPTFADAVTVPANKTVDCDGIIRAGSLSLGEKAIVSVFGTVTTPLNKVYSINNATKDGRKARDKDLTDPIGLFVAGNLAIGSGAQLAVGGYGQACPAVVSVGGDLTIAATGKAFVYPGPAKTLAERMLGGGRVFVAGDTSIAGELRTYTHVGERVMGTAAGVVLDFASATVEEGGLVCAPCGASWNTTVSEFSGGGAKNRYDGTGHGGNGGLGSGAGATPTGGGAAFGCAFAPIGATRLAGNTLASQIGAGAVAIRAVDLVVNGTVSASAVPGFYNLGTEGGGIAGGSVWILAGTLAMGENAKLEAAGTDGGTHTTTAYNDGGGAGGRIAVGVNLSDEMIAVLETQTYPEGIDEPVALAGVYRGQIDVSGGKGKFNGGNGEAGTAVYYQVAPPDEHTLSVVTSPADLDVDVTPALGVHTFKEADDVTVALTESFAYLDAEHTRRMTCTGYVVTGPQGEVRRGDGTSVALGHLTENLTVTFTFSSEQRAVETGVLGKGTVTPSGTVWAQTGTAVTLTATPAAGETFRCWAIDDTVGPGVAMSPVLTLPVRRFTRVRAIFSGIDGLAERTFTGAANDGGLWETPGNWSPEGVPGAGDAVIVPDGKTVSVRQYAAVGSLTVGDKAIVSVAGEVAKLYNHFYSQYGNDGRGVAKDLGVGGIGLAVGGDLTVNGSGAVAIGGFELMTASSLAVGGDLTLNGTSTLAVYPGPAGTEERPYAYGGGRITVAGALAVNDTATSLTYGHIGKSIVGTTACVVYDLNLLTVASGAKVASNVGCDQYVPTSLIPASSANSSFAGSGHGGRGADGEHTNGAHYNGGEAYDWPYAPRWPGRESRHDTSYNPLGAGVVRIEARRIELAGTIDVTQPSFSYTTETGGGSGGSVWITAESFKARPGAAIVACGHDGGIHTTQKYKCGGGAGGRVAISLRLSPEELAAFQTTGECAAKRLEYVDLSVAKRPVSLANLTVNVRGGENRVGVTGESWGQAEDGSAWLIRPQSGLVLMVK